MKYKVMSMALFFVVAQSEAIPDAWAWPMIVGFVGILLYIIGYFIVAAFSRINKSFERIDNILSAHENKMNSVDTEVKLQKQRIDQLDEEAKNYTEEIRNNTQLILQKLKV